MPDNFLIIPTSNITDGRIDSLANARHVTDLNLTAQALPNGQEVTVYQLSNGVSGIPVAAGTGPVTLTIADFPYPDFPIVVAPDLSTVTIALSGTIDGPVSGLEGRLIQPDGSIVQNWTPLQSPQITAATWAANLVASPGADRYLAEVRAVGQTASVAQTVPFRTAAVLASYGQSNTILFFDNDDLSVTARSDTFHLRNGTFGAPEGGMKTLLNELALASGLSWVGITGGTNGAPIGALDNTLGGAFDQSTAPLDNFRADIASIGRRPTVAVFHQGEGNAVVAEGQPIIGYETSFDDIWGAVAGDYPNETGDLPKFIPSLTTWGGNQYDAGWSTVDQWHIDLAATKPDVYWGGSWKDARRLDNFHGYPSDYTQRAKRTAEHIKAYLGLTSPFEVFRIGTARIVDATTTDVTVIHGQGTAMNIRDVIEKQEAYGTNTTQVRGFEVASDSSYVTATGTIIDATTIRLTHANIGTANRNLRYLYGALPDTSGMVLDNSAAAMPLLHTGIVPIVASGATAAATFAQQTLEIPASDTPFTATSQLPGADRFLYTVQISKERTLTFTNGGVAVTPLAVIDMANSDGKGVPTGTVNPIYVFETDTLDEISINLSGGGFNGAYGVTLTEAKGTTGAWSIADIVTRVPLSSEDSTLTHEVVDIPEGDVVTGIIFGDISPVDLSAYVSATIDTYSPGFGATQAAVATSLSNGLPTYYEAILNGSRRRMASVIATISAA